MNETVALAKALADYGPWAIVALQMLALRWLVVRYDNAQEARIKEGKELGALVASNTDALRRTHALIEGQNATVASLTVRLQQSQLIGGPS